MNDTFEAPLFAIPESKSPRLLWMEKIKEEHRIFTHHAPGAGEWLALPMNVAVEKLKGYRLTDEQMTCGTQLIAGYGRLLDESCIITEGHETECDALVAVAKAMGIKLWNEE